MQIFVWTLLYCTFMKIFFNDAENLNSYPVVGVVVQEVSENTKKFYPKYSTYLAASYVKALENSGARVLPILMSKPDIYYK